MKVKPWLQQASKQLIAAGVSTAHLDCLILLEDTTHKDRGWLLAHPEYKLTNPQIAKLDTLIARRSTHEPLAYLRNKTEFYGREFYIDHRVLEPRPESEAIIDLLKAMELPDTPVIIDIGTGSGMLAITATLEIPTATVIATDIDQNCLDVAAINSEKHQATVELQPGDLLEAVTNRISPAAILLCNLPYVPDSFQINPAAMAEPRIAIFGGADGLDLYRKLFGQLQVLEQRPLSVLTESLPPQHEELTSIALAAGFSLKKTDDFIQMFSSR